MLFGLLILAVALPEFEMLDVQNTKFFLFFPYFFFVKSLLMYLCNKLLGQQSNENTGRRMIEIHIL